MSLPNPLEPSARTTLDEMSVDEHPAAVYLAGLAPNSRRTMRGALDTIAQIGLGNRNATLWDVPWHRLRFQHTQSIRAVLADRYTHSTANVMLSALRGVLKAAWKIGLMNAEEYQKAASVESVRGETVPAGRALAHGEIASLWATCDDTPLGIRDAALISILYGCGLRRSEAVSLDLADYAAATSTLRVRGKGNKQRLVPLGSAAPALEDWLAVRKSKLGALFHGLGNRNSGRRLTDRAVYHIMTKRGKEAGLESFSPHDFRRTFVGDLLDAGADVVTVQKLAGHADPATTSRYDRRDERAGREAVNHLHVPYRKRMVRKK